MLSKSRESLKLINSIDASAFASILTVLLFTMMTFGGMAYSPHSGVTADLPQAWHPVAMPSALREDVMEVSVMRDGRVYFGVESINPIHLPEKIADRLKDRGVERKVYIVADQRARWGSVKPVLDGVRRAGIIRVAFLVNQRRLPGALSGVNSPL